MPGSAVTPARVIGDLRAQITYRPIEGPVSWQVTTESAVRRQDSTSFQVVGHSVGSSLSWPLTTRIRLQASASGRYQPSYSLFGNMPVAERATPISDGAAVVDTGSGALDASAVDFSLARTDIFGADAGTSIVYDVTRRLSASLSGGFNRVRFPHEGSRNALGWNAASRLQYALSRDLGVHAGYGRRASTVGAADGVPISMDDFDLGVDFARGLSLTKAIRLMVTSGTSFSAVDGRHEPHLVGGASLQRDFGRSWAIQFGVTRAGRLPVGFTTPVYSTSWSLAGTGRIGRNLGVQLSSELTDGEAGRGMARGIRTTGGRASATYTISRALQAYLSYAGSRFELGADVDALDALPPRQSRHLVSAGLSFDLTLLRTRIRPPRRH